MPAATADPITPETYEGKTFKQEGVPAGTYRSGDLLRAPGGDPVAKFHLGNGARLERLNPGADRSAKGLRQSHGWMVNYLYDLREVEERHERFVHGEVVAARAIERLR